MVKSSTVKIFFETSVELGTPYSFFHCKSENGVSIMGFLDFHFGEIKCEFHITCILSHSLCSTSFCVMDYESMIKERNLAVLGIEMLKNILREE